MGSDSVSEDLVPIVQALALLTVLTMAVTDVLARCLFKRPTHTVQSSNGVINNLIKFSSLNLVIILVILYKIFVSLVFKQFATYGTTGTLGLLGFVVMNKNVRVHIFVRARRRLETASVGGGEGLVARIRRLSTRVAPSTSASRADQPVSQPAESGRQQRGGPRTGQRHQGGRFPLRGRAAHPEACDLPS